MPPPPLHRHQLAWLTPEGWEHLGRLAWDAQATECLDWWSKQRLPLVVTQQRPGSVKKGSIALGLPAPRRWDRRRLALTVQREHLMYFGEFPEGHLVEKLLPRPARAAWRELCSALKACGATPRVHGSFGWQHITHMSYVHPGSDIDICIEPLHARQADLIAARLQAWTLPGIRVDGELVFAGGQAVAWREWLAWRAGRVGSVLVKDLQGSRLSRNPTAHETVQAAAA